MKIFESFFKINHSQALLKIKLSDGSVEKYIDGIITEFQMISLRTKNAIFENEILSKNSEKFWNLSSLKQIN